MLKFTDKNETNTSVEMKETHTYIPFLISDFYPLPNYLLTIY